MEDNRGDIMQILSASPALIASVVIFVVCVVIGFFGDKRLKDEKMLKEQSEKDKNKVQTTSDIESSEDNKEEAPLITSQNINNLDSKVTEKMDKLQICDAITEIFNLLRLSNKYIDDTTPWILAKDEASRDRLETVIYNLLESIRVCAILLQPFMPETNEKILKQINNTREEFNYIEDNKYELTTPEVLFQRIDKEKFLEEV